MANFCSECKTENSEKSKFCSSCGTALVITQSKMTSFPDAIKLFFRRCFDFRGRSTRAEYWWTFLFVGLVCFVLSLIEGGIFLANSDTVNSDLRFSFLTRFWFLVILIPSLSLGVRRLHDISQDGKLILLSVPLWVNVISDSFFHLHLPGLISGIFFIMCLPLFFWAILSSHKVTNKHGPPRQQNVSQ